MLLATGCGPGPAALVQLTGAVTARGVEVTLEGAVVSDHPLPYREGPPGSHCAIYTLTVRSVDDMRHELRPSDFQSAGASPVDAVARCDGPQFEPTWIDRQQRVVELTILEGDGAPTPLYWRPR
jgi:hypothetical protein